MRSTSKEITEIINTLCEKLGVAASILVPEMAKYNIARLAFLTVAYGIFAVVLTVVFVRIVKHFLTSEDIDEDEKPVAILLVSLIPGMVLVVLIVCTINNATDLIGWIASPTASAVKEIISMIK